MSAAPRIQDAYMRAVEAVREQLYRGRITVLACREREAELAAWLDAQPPHYEQAQSPGE